MLSSDRKSDAVSAALGIGAAAVAIACCAGLPATAALVGGLTLCVVLCFALGWTAVATITPRRARGPVTGGRR